MDLRKLAWLLPLLFCCCTKNDPTPKKHEDFTFTTVYDSTIDCYANSIYAMTFSVKVLSGGIAGNEITYTISGLPADITVIPSSQTVSRLMGGSFAFTIGNVPVGKDTITLTISCPATGTQTHKIILNVQAPPDYAPLLAGMYNNTFDFCQPDSFINYTSVITTVADTPYEIKIHNLKNMGTGFIVTAWVSNIVTIPVQTVGGYTLWGAGNFYHDAAGLYQLNINDTLVHGLDTGYCTVHLSH